MRVGMGQGFWQRDGDDTASLRRPSHDKAFRQALALLPSFKIHARLPDHTVSPPHLQHVAGVVSKAR
jgi:hypothetical protein